MTMTPPPLPGKRPKPPKEPRAPKPPREPRAAKPAKAPRAGRAGRAGRSSSRVDDDFWDAPVDEGPRPGRGAVSPTSQRQVASDRPPADTGPARPADDGGGGGGGGGPKEPTVSWVAKLDDTRRRGRIAMVVAIAVIPLAVLFSGVSEYRAASGQPSTISSTTTTTAPADDSGTTALPVQAVPPGDYTALCAKLDPDAKNLGSDADLRVVSQVLLRADVDGYIAASPAGFKPILEDLKRTREAAAKTLEMGTGPVTQAQKAVLPDTYLPNLVLLSLVIDDECR